MNIRIIFYECDYMQSICTKIPDSQPIFEPVRNFLPGTLHILCLQKLAVHPSSHPQARKKYEWSKLDDNGKKKVHREILETITIVIRLKDIVNEYDGLRLEYWESGEHHGDNPLHLAAFHGHLMIVKFLMEEVSFYK